MWIYHFVKYADKVFVLSILKKFANCQSFAESWSGYLQKHSLKLHN